MYLVYICLNTRPIDITFLMALSTNNNLDFPKLGNLYPYKNTHINKVVMSTCNKGLFIPKTSPIFTS